MNLSAIRSGFGLLGAGRVMVDAVKGKKAQVAAGAITTFLGLLIAFGDSQFHLHLAQYAHTAAEMFGMPDGQFMAGAGVFLYGLFNWILTAATTDKIGITGRTAPVPPAPVDAAAGPTASPAPAPGVQPAPDALPRQDAESLRAGG
jgi:hypothetical protein